MAHYDCYCYLPLYVFCGHHPLAAKLRAWRRLTVRWRRWHASLPRSASAGRRYATESPPGLPRTRLSVLANRYAQLGARVSKGSLSVKQPISGNELWVASSRTHEPPRPFASDRGAQMTRQAVNTLMRRCRRPHAAPFLRFLSGRYARLSRPFEG